VDATKWSATGLAKHIVEQATGRRPPVISGPRWWANRDGVTLRALADSLTDMPTGAFDWTPLHRILDQLPAGRWTTYGDLAAVVGTSPQPLGQHIATCKDCTHAWRVLDRDGRIAPGFKWSEPGRSDDPAHLLTSEGVSLRDGRADQSQRLSRDELIGMMPTSDLTAEAKSYG
jgi:alkylated DNA nucleotide flippase Atl1